MSEPPPTSESLLEQALAHHRAGRLQEAERGYIQILACSPGYPQALHYLGVIAIQAGQPQAAIPLLNQALRALPHPEVMNNLAEAFRMAGQYGPALELLRRAVHLAPRFAEARANLALVLAHLNRADEALAESMLARQLNAAIASAWYAAGLAHHQMRQLDQAIDAYAQTLRVQPGHVQALVEGGAALQERGSIDQAIQWLRKATEAAPGHAKAFSMLGNALAEKQQWDAATAAARRGTELNPQAPQTHLILARILSNSGSSREAETSARKAMEQAPGDVSVMQTLANILDDQLRLDEAVEAMEAAARRAPDAVPLLASLGRLYSRAGRDEDAFRTLRRALELNPNYLDAHGHLALALLNSGDLKAGFQEYEWRWRLDSFTTKPREFDRPMWTGSDPAGRTILVHSEQGFGDVIQFARYLPMLAGIGAKVIVEAPAMGLLELLREMRCVSQVVPLGMKFPDFDLHLPLLSLPRAFGTTLETIPNPVPYLRPDPTRVADWKSRIDQLAEKSFRVGIVWGGNKKPDRRRSIPLQEMSPLFQIPRVQYFSLQKGDPLKELESAPANWPIINLSEDIKTFADTAAAMLAMDLVITIDTSTAHLAGAIGAKTWTLLPWLADWRWLRGREDSPWYSTMRLYRQSQPDNWTAVVRRLADNLHELASHGA